MSSLNTYMWNRKKIVAMHLRAGRNRDTYEKNDLVHTSGEGENEMVGEIERIYTLACVN